MTNKLCGIILIIMGIISIPICDYDATAAVFIILVGILGLIIPTDGGDENEEDNGRR